MKTVTELDQKLTSLLCKINKVTAPFRHGQKIPNKALVALADYQTEFEQFYEKNSEKNCKVTPGISTYPLSNVGINKGFVNMANLAKEKP